MALFEAAVNVDANATYAALDELGLHQIALAFHKIN